MEIIVNGEIIFRLSGFEGAVCMKRDVRELWDTLSAPIQRKGLTLYGMQGLRHARGNSDTT
jgi:hypothetical protein